MRNALLVFLLIVVLGLLWIMVREHRQQPAPVVDPPQAPVLQEILIVSPASHWQFQQQRIA